MIKYYFFFGEGSKVNQIICAALINMPVFAYGAAIGWMSPMTLLLQSDHSPRTPLTDQELSWMAGIAYIVCVPSDFLMGYLSDKMGRKRSLLFMSATAAICWIVKLSSLDTWAFVLARGFVGVTMGGAYVTCPLYTKEISEDSIRGSLGSLVTLFHTTGNLFLYVVGDIMSYYSVLWLCLSIPLIHIVLFLTMPESPSHLVKKGKLDEAVKVLAWLRCRNEDDSVVQRELEVLKKEQKNDEDMDNRFIMKTVFQDKILFRAFRIAIIVSLAREFCGVIPVTNFAGHIFANASEGGSGLVLTPNQQAIMLGTVQVAGSALASSVVEKAGRKSLLFTTALISGISMTVLASWFLVRDFGVWAPGWIPVATLCLCIFCDASGLLPVSVILTGEMFSYKYRGTIMATAMSTASFAAFLQMFFFKPLASAVGIHAAFYFFGVTCLIGAIYIILVVPETKQRSLEEVHESLKTKSEKKADMMVIQKTAV